MERISRTAASAALALILATGCSRDLPGGSGGERPRRGAADAEVGAPQDAEALEPYEPKHGSTPQGTDEVYEEVVSALDWAYEELGDPAPGYESMSRVQDTAARQLSGQAFEWPSGTSYYMSVLDDRIAVYINCNGTEKKGDWRPTLDGENPS